ncbi:phage scaffolding protein [Clostridium sp. 1001275B_160808_H3]|jgi:Phage minor structural protein GP20|uniref:phage scaffolding protein n=1 Tax=Clostridium sp. 1001275B_160808_H3 TaxID=2787110 RepID=UPI001897CFDE|nr:phage scaffolding protein [Clostridium sp. 1001275B_160808_H3]
MEWLRKLLEGAKKKEDGSIDIDDLMKQINVEFPKNAVPKDKYNDVSEQLKTANTTITDLKKNNSDNESLQKTIEDHENTIKSLKNESLKKAFDMALELELVKAQAKNTKALKAVLDLEKVKQKEDGSFDGLDEQLKSLKESDGYLFETGRVKKVYRPKGGVAVEGDLKNLMKNPNFNLTEYLENQNKQ